MTRGDLGGWGRGLGDGELACALAALGIVAESGRPGAAPGRDELTGLLQRTWQHWHDTGYGPVPWHMAGLELLDVLPAPLLLEAWRASEPPPWGLRLEVRPAGAKSPVWLVRALAHADVSAAGIFVRVDEPAVEVTWGWPLRVGLLPGRRSTALRSLIDAGLREASSLQRLVTLVDATAPDADCDLLLLPWDARTALQRILELPHAPYADCIVLLGSGAADDDRTYGLLAAIRAAARTSGVAVVDMPADRELLEQPRWRWIESVANALSHNEPLDVALWQSSPAEGAPTLLIAAARLVEQGRLERQVRRMASELKLDAYHGEVMAVPPGSAMERVLELPAGDWAFADVAAAMEHRSDDDYLRESDMATAAAEVHEAMAAAVPEPPADDRFIQAQVSDVSDPVRPVRRHRSLRQGAQHEIAVRIGPPDEAWLADLAGEPVPVHELPPADAEHELTVVLADTALRAAPQVARITLPRHGASTTARFETAAAEGMALGWRISVLHGNRVLQTALLHAPIGGDADDGDGIDVVVEAIVRPAVGALSGRSHFDGALVVNHTADGQAGVTGIRDGDARSFRVSPSLATAITSLDAHLSNVAYNVGAFDAGVGGEDFRALVWNLAHIGSALCQHIVHDALGGDPIPEEGLLHVLSAMPEARLPVEFIYDRDPPVADAPLCAGAQRALSDGKCGGDGCPGADARHTVICPLGFWGLSKVIERHRHDPALARAHVGADEFSFRSEPARPRDRLHVLRRTIVGSNYRVEQSAADALRTVCRDVTGRDDPIRTWQEWQDEIQRDAPSLLVLVVHSEATPDLPLPRIEIGTDDWVMSTMFRGTYLRPSATAPKPVLLLLGCETGSPPMDFGHFIASARTHGAAIVVAAGALIHSVHAVEVTAELVAALRSHVASSQDTTFGTVFRAVRRDLFARGRPMILTLNAYGDADWHLD